MNLKNAQLLELDEFLDRTASSYLTDYSMLDHMVSKIETTDLNRAHLNWCLVHFKTSMVDIHKTIKNFQGRLREIDASTKI